MRKIVGLAVVLGVLASLSASVMAQRSRSNADLITAEQLRDYLTFVASDEMEGRDTPSHGLDTTALFISTLLKRWGAKPAGGDGTFFQRIEMERVAVDPTRIRLQLNDQTFVFGQDYLLDGRIQFEKRIDATITAPLVYVGDGWMVKSKHIDDYKGIDAKGKIVVVNYYDGYSPPRGVTYADLTGKEGTDWATPETYARQRGAVGVLFLSPLGEPDWDIQRLWNTQGNWAMAEMSGSAQPPLPVLRCNAKVMALLFQGEKSDASAVAAAIAAGTSLPAFDLNASKKVTLAAVTKAQSTTTQNIVAVFEGSDPVLKNEYVALGAHYDHLGATTPPINGDSIYNGADDDGSGTVALMGMAEALSKARRRPRRSTLFVWHCGEEKGLWGSSYFTTHPTVPIKQIVTQLNIDMIGRSRMQTDLRNFEMGTSGPDEIYVVGSKRLSSELGALSEKVNNGYLKLHFNYKFDDPNDPSGIYSRSDHINYVSKGIPIIFYYDGMEYGDYHQMGDEVQKIDFLKMQKVTRTIYETLWAVSNLPKRPVIDKNSHPN